ncbi:MAG: DNA translocase FtsK, partial [Oscillospiraceae bacterium]|nr:DNA translocase FtsK [Oscillospiraceae bacterium]
GVSARVIDINRGPAVTRYELQPGAGVKVSKIAGLSDDLALNLAAKGVRIEAPIPGKAAVGVEVPNKNRDIVNIRELIESKEFQEAKSKLTVALGKDIVGNVVLADLKEMPHLLVAGSTGSGKSVCINAMIISLMYKANPDEVKLLLIDPKVVELNVYNGIPHLLIPVVTDPRKAAGALNWAVSEMLKRYQLFADNSVRDIEGYNKLADSRDDMQRMPKVVIIIDELADLMLVAASEVEDSINRLAALARAAGMHLVVATQRPSVDVITGVIKANIGSRIAFKTSSQVDSRTILPDGSAEKLLGKGDMLFYPQTDMRRVQGCFVSDGEVEEVVRFVKNGGTAAYDEGILDDIEKLAVKEKGKKSSEEYSSEGGGFDDGDDMLDAAIECVIEMGLASTSMLQRKLKLGYARAARILDQMEERGIVGPFEGSKPRQVLITKEQWLEKQLQSDE